MNIDLSKRQRFVLAALATEPGASFAPVQVQKLFFLLDENVAGALGGRQFAFEPYDYGPFDKAVYRELESLERLGLVNVTSVGSSAGRRHYTLTPVGQEEGQRALAAITEPVSDYMTKVSTWVRSMPFAQLVGSVYKAYPNMRENSIFQD